LNVSIQSILKCSCNPVNYSVVENVKSYPNRLGSHTPRRRESLNWRRGPKWKCTYKDNSGVCTAFVVNLLRHFRCCHPLLTKSEMLLYMRDARNERKFHRQQLKPVTETSNRKRLGAIIYRKCPKCGSFNRRLDTHLARVHKVEKGIEEYWSTQSTRLQE
jgi:hypothetical protein